MTAKKRNTKRPTSKATNAYDLLTDIGKIAIADPRRMRMKVWSLAGDHELLRWGIPPTEHPACGTVGCIGGWANILRPHSTLGLTARMRMELFFNDTLCRAADQGTLAHAKRVVAHIRKFQRKYAKRLKAEAM